ncbi:MAG TPA: DUF1572 family protein [Agriterribacter sp.]|nr:DUF1572 family protein [Agriterribacter sp.]
MNSIGDIFLQSAIKRVKYYKELGEQAFQQLSDEDFYFKPNKASNNLSVIIQHMSGNMLSRWTHFLTEDGEKTWRNRDMEFNDQHFSRARLMELWEKGWQCFIGALEGLREADLLTTVYIRQEPLTAIDAINRQLAHYPHHVGQILYLGKLIKGDEWKSLSIERNQSAAYNAMMARKK